MKEIAIGLLISTASISPSLIDEISVTQEEYFMENGKYQQIVLEGDMYVHEYVNPQGFAGYQILYIKDGEVVSVGYGPEAEARTFSELRLDVE